MSGYEDQGGAVLPLARLYMARGEGAMARSTLEQALKAEGTSSLYRAPLLLMMVEVLVATGDVVGAHQAAGQLGSWRVNAERACCWHRRTWLRVR